MQQDSQNLLFVRLATWYFLDLETNIAFGAMKQKYVKNKLLWF